MLVLARKENERIVIDGNIVLTVVRVSGGAVRLGIEAPREVAIKREELLTTPRFSDSGKKSNTVPECAGK
jgi:carbon storage regulator